MKGSRDFDRLYCNHDSNNNSIKNNQTNNNGMNNNNNDNNNNSGLPLQTSLFVFDPGSFREERLPTSTFLVLQVCIQGPFF